jgi:CBS domain-containing protein
VGVRLFFIIEQGARISTPVDQLLRSDGVPEVSAARSVRRVGPGGPQARAQRLVKMAPYLEEDSAAPRSAIIYAHQIMTSPVISASIGQSLNEIWTLFSQQGFHHLPLLDEEQRLQGIVSDRDLLRFAANNHRDVGDYSIGQLMSRRVISAGEQTEIRTIAEVMCQRGIGAIPIVDEQVAVIGIVTRSDILRTLVHRAPLELWA